MKVLIQIGHVSEILGAKDPKEPEVQALADRFAVELRALAKRLGCAPVGSAVMLIKLTEAEFEKALGQDIPTPELRPDLEGPGFPLANERRKLH